MTSNHSRYVNQIQIVVSQSL